jgi:signal transduction histidine kinase
MSVAGLFLVSGIAAIMGVYGGTRRRVRRVFLPAAIITLAAVFAYPLRGFLPPLIEEVGLAAMLADPPTEISFLPGFTGLALASAVAAVAALVGAIVLYRLTWGRGGPTSDAFTALGLVILLVAEVQNAFWPSVYASLVTIADVMRLVATAVLVAGAIADQRSDLRALRSAYMALDRMRVNDAERAALEERARLAREIHDGLAQHLWFAKLKFERLAGRLSEDEQPLAAEVTQALDAAIVEAREALVTMRASVTEDVPFPDMLQRTIDDFEDRSGLRVDLSMPMGLPAALAPRVQVELLRIVSEALTNVQKHADATTVRITAEVAAGELLITITDNGRGFVPDEAFDRGMGLRGMEERARLISGNLTVLTELSGGTTVEVRVPVTAPGIASVSETTERTAMAPDLEQEEDGRDVWAAPEPADTEIDPGAVGSGATSLRGTTSGPDIAPKGVQT